MSEVKHDYKAALDVVEDMEFQGKYIWFTQEHGREVFDPVRDAIIHALKLADKVKGEPTPSMLLATSGENTYKTFQAMIAQAEKEIG